MQPISLNFQNKTIKQDSRKDKKEKYFCGISETVNRWHFPYVKNKNPYHVTFDYQYLILM